MKLGKGFTLIELMIVMVGMIMVSGGSIAAYLRFNNNQQISNDTRRFLTEIHKARSLASSLQYPSGCQQMSGVNISSALVDGLQQAVVVTTTCGSGNITGDEVQVLSNSTFGSPFSVTFLAGSGYVSGGEDVGVTVISQANQDITKTVTISTYGGVSVENGPVQ